MTDNITLPREVVAQIRGALAYVGAGNSSTNPNLAQSTCRQAIWKLDHALRAALEQPQNHVPDVGNMVPAGWKLVLVESTEEMLRAGCGSESPAMLRESLRRETDGQKTFEMVEKIIQRNLNSYRAMLAAAPQPPTAEQSLTVVEECSADELKPRFSAHDDAERLKSVARGTSYNDHGEAVWKHTLMEIAVRLESGGYAAPQPQGEQEPVATLHCTEECYVYARATDAGKRIRFEQPIDLYTHPQPKREPLTHYEIHELFRRSWDDCQDGDEIKAFARAIEAAHDIGNKG